MLLVIRYSVWLMHNSFSLILFSAGHYNRAMAIRVLYDGWPLIYEADGPATLEMSALLSLAPGEVEPVVALPVEHSPEGFLQDFELVHAASRDPLAWQQRRLPDLAREHGAALIHSTQPAASLLGGVPTVVSPSGYEGMDPAGRSLRARLGQALGRGGLARAIVLYPDDIPAPRRVPANHAVPPAAHPHFTGNKNKPPADLELPQGYLLYHGPSHPGTLLGLLESWTWAAASIGELHPLVLLGLSEPAKWFVEERLPDFHLEDYVHLLPRAHPAHIASIYQNSAGLAHPAPPSIWGGPVRLALACGLPVAAHQHAATEAMVGAAAYLVEPGDWRAFGAAMITIVVHDQVRGDLQAAAKKQRARWEASAFQEGLMGVYRDLI